MSTLPDSAYPVCLRCGQPIRETSRVLHEVVGYTRPRSDGGANHIIARRETGRLVCGGCAPAVQRGDAPGQEGLF